MISLVLLSLCCLITIGVGDNNVFLLQQDLAEGTYALDCASIKLAGISANNSKNLLIYDLKGQLLVSEQALPVPGKRVIFSRSLHGVIFIVHEGYVSVLKGDQLSTYFMPADTYSLGSFVSVEDCVCFFPDLVTAKAIVCMSTDGSTQFFQINSTLSDLYGGVAFMNGIWAYVVGRNGTVLKLQWINNSWMYTGFKTEPEFYDGSMWFSNDGSRIFLSNGHTLESSSNIFLDLQPHGSFEDSEDSMNASSYTYFSQSSQPPFSIAAVRGDSLNDTVYYYNWPYLQQTGAKTVPIPSQAQSISSTEQVHICDQTKMTYVIAEYTVGSKTTIGVAYIPN